MKRFSTLTLLIAAAGLSACGSEEEPPAAVTKTVTVEVPEAEATESEEQSAQTEDAVETETETETATPEPTEEPTVAEESTEADKPQPTEEPEYSSRGNVVKEIGEPAFVVDGDDVQVTFTLKSAEVDYKCTSGMSDPPQNGQFVAFEFSMDVESDSNVVPTLSEYELSIVGPDGTLENDSEGNAWLCAADSATLPSEVGVGQKANGIIVLDTQYPEGTLIISGEAFGFYDDEGAWEYSYGS